MGWAIGRCETSKSKKSPEGGESSSKVSRRGQLDRRWRRFWAVRTPFPKPYSWRLVRLGSEFPGMNGARRPRMRALRCLKGCPPKMRGGVGNGLVSRSDGLFDCIVKNSSAGKGVDSALRKSSVGVTRLARIRSSRTRCGWFWMTSCHT